MFTSTLFTHPSPGPLAGWGRPRILTVAALAVAILAAGDAPLYAQAPPADTTALHLDDLLRDVRRANPSLRGARLAAEALGARQDQVSALPDPMAGITYQPYPMLTARGAQRSQWQLQQRIPFPGKRRLQGEIAGLRAEAAASEADALARDLEAAVKAAYYELYRIQEQVRLVRQFQEELEEFEEAAATQYEVGTGTQQAILKAQVERGRLDVRLDRLGEERRSARQVLARLLDRPDLEGLTGEVRVAPPTTVEAEDLVAVALENRPEVEALRQTQERAGRQEALARRASWPDLTVGVSYTDIRATDLMPTMTGRDALAVSVGIQMPLWRGKQRAQVEEARLEERRAEAHLDALRLAIRTQIDDLQGRLRQQQKQLTRLQETLIPQAETAREAALSAYSADRTDFLNLLDAERTLFQLQMDYEATYARHLKTVASLERALGVTSLGEMP